MYVTHKKLRIISYDDNKHYEKIYHNRLSSTSTIITYLEIHPFSQNTEQRIVNESYPIFLMLIPDMIPLIENIYTNSKKLSELNAKIPGIASEKLIINLLIEEIMSTNDIEGVKSSRIEINKAIQVGNTEKVRFSGIVKLYKGMLENKKITILNLEDFRRLYDDLVLEEISESDVPDGKLFRKKGVAVSGNGKTYHRGDPNEEVINNNMNKLIFFMNNSDVSYVIKAIVTHYFFEYIHPFYDGNGRMGRFLLSRYLARKVDIYTGLSVSQGVLKNKTKYEESFIEMSHPKNRAEITFFIIDMLKIIIDGQKKIIKQMILYKKQFDRIEEYVEKIGNGFHEKHVLSLLIQNSLFDTVNNYLSNKELYEYSKANKLKIGRNKIDKVTENLEKRGLLLKIKNRPITYTITDTLEHELE